MSAYQLVEIYKMTRRKYSLWCIQHGEPTSFLFAHSDWSKPVYPSGKCTLVKFLSYMILTLQCLTAMLLLSAMYESFSANAEIIRERSTTSTSRLLRVQYSSIGSVAAGCTLCRDSGNCSVAINNTSSGVFCGDLLVTAQPCCCPYYAECRATRKSQTCECGGTWPLATHHKRLSATEAANETLDKGNFAQEDNEWIDNQMSVSTEIFIHLSAYLALFVFATYVDQWVECFSDFRRNQMIMYEAVDTDLAHFRQRLGKRRQDSQIDTGNDGDKIPLLVSESPAPTTKPAYFNEVIHADIPHDEAPNVQVVEDTFSFAGVQTKNISPLELTIDLIEISSG